MRLEIIMLVVVMILVAAVLVVSNAKADTYLSATIAEVECPLQRNTDEVECDAADGYAYKLGGGWIDEVGMFEVRYGPTAMVRRGDLHGQNETNERRMTADGRHITIYGLMGHAEIGIPIYDVVTPFVALDAGPVAVNALGDTRAAAAIEPMAGLRLTLGSAEVTAGYSWYFQTHTKHKGLWSHYRDEGAFVGIGWRRRF